MNALLYILVMLGGLFGMNYDTSQAQFQGQGYLEKVEVAPQTYGLDQINVNPRTVVVLEDTHFKPAK